MGDSEAGPSQSPRQSPSVVIPESPGSPNILDPESPGSPQVEVWHAPDTPEPFPGALDSDTTESDPTEPSDGPTINTDDNTSDSVSTVNYDTESRDRPSRTVSRNTDTDTDTDRNDDDRSEPTNRSEYSNVAVASNRSEDSNSNVASNLARAGSSRLSDAASNEEPNRVESLPQVQIRKHVHSDDEPPAKVRKLSQKSNEDLDGETCPICFDSWGNSGEHRLVALKCGHLFGSQCVERWLREQSVKDRSCPTCKTKAAMRDIRPIYARKLVAADVSQITTLQKQMDALQSEKIRVELELQKTRIAHRACVMQLEVLRSTLMKAQVPKEHQVRKSWRFALEKNLEIFKDGGCRVLTYNCRTYELYVSQKSMNYLFPGYGIRKVSCVDYKLGQFVHLHPKPIRDITYSQPRDLLLSVGLDSSARIVERGILSVTVQSGVPLWSCSWDYLRSNEFYVGGIGGVIHQYDVRNPSTYIQRLQAPGDMSPVVSLCSTEYGLLSCQLNSCWLWVSNMRQWQPRALPIEGPFMSLCYDNESHRALVSCRAGSNGERSRLALCKLRASVPSGDIVVDAEQNFSGSSRTSLMSRASFVRAPGASWIAAHSESDSTLYLHGLDGARTITLPASEPALDVASVQLNGDTLVAGLSESRLRVYKAVPTSS